MLTPQELELRKTTIGSSDVGAICGLNPWKSRGDVLKAKLDPSAAMNSPSFVIGHAVEKTIAELALEFRLLGKRVTHLTPGWTVIRDGWQTATPDFYGNSGLAVVGKNDEGIVIEVKNVGYRQLPAWEYGKKVPDFVLSQVQWQMMVVGKRRARVAAFLGGAEVKTYLVKRDDTWLDELEAECRSFWERHLCPGKRNKIWARVKLENIIRKRVAA